MRRKTKELIESLKQDRLDLMQKVNLLTNRCDSIEADINYIKKALEVFNSPVAPAKDETHSNEEYFMKLRKSGNINSWAELARTLGISIETLRLFRNGAKELRHDDKLRFTRMINKRS